MANDKVLDDIQKIVISAVLKDSYILAKVRGEIKTSYFTKFTYRIIYKSILYYYNKYSKIPTELELKLVIKDLLTDDLCSIDEALADLHEVYELPVSSLDFVTDQVTRFIKHKRLECTLREFMPKIKEGDSLCIDELGDRLSENVTLNLHNSKAFQISDIEQLEDVRRESVGLDDHPTIIKSVINGINDSLLYRGYKSGDVVIVVAKPGCFTGDTKILLDNGNTAFLEDLYNSKKEFGIRGFDFSKRKYRVGTCQGVTLTGYAYELLKIVFENGSSVKCTRDHLFLLANRDIYVKAEDLRIGEYVRSNCSEYRVKITHIELIMLDESIPVYDIYCSNVDNNYLVYAGDDSGFPIGVSVHNCGKTMFMVNELANAAKQGYNSLHLFIGDMTEYDGLVRYLSNVSGVAQDDIAGMDLEKQRGLVSNINSESEILSHITVKSYAASEISVEQMIEDVFKIQNDLKIHYDIIAVDYPDNLIKNQENMYESGGDIYNRLSYLARRNKSVILAGSQPKISNWNDEIIPLSGCAESSKKQHIADLIIALGRPSNDSNLLTGFLAKVRRGTMGTIFRIKTEFERARLQSISEFDYVQLKSRAAETKPKREN